MATPRQAKSALHYIQRLVEDEFVQEQLRNAAGDARAAYVRARTQRSEAVEDKRLYRNLRQAATSIRNATTALKPPKPQPKHRIRKLAAVVLAIGGCAWLTMKLQRLQSQGKSDSGAASAQDDTAATGADASQRISEPERAAMQTAG